MLGELALSHGRLRGRCQPGELSSGVGEAGAGGEQIRARAGVQACSSMLMGARALFCIQSSRQGACGLTRLSRRRCRSMEKEAGLEVRAHLGGRA